MLTRKQGFKRGVCVEVKWLSSGNYKKIPFRILWDESRLIYWFIQLTCHHFTIIYFRCDSEKYFMIPSNFQKHFVAIVPSVFMTLGVLNMYQRNIRNDLIIHSKAR